MMKVLYKFPVNVIPNSDNEKSWPSVKHQAILMVLPKKPIEAIFAELSYQYDVIARGFAYHNKSIFYFHIRDCDIAIPVSAQSGIPTNTSDSSWLLKVYAVRYCDNTSEGDNPPPLRSKDNDFEKIRQQRDEFRRVINQMIHLGQAALK